MDHITMKPIVGGLACGLIIQTCSKEIWVS